MFTQNVDARKDAHSNLLSKKETSGLYKIQCEYTEPSSVFETAKEVKSFRECLRGGVLLMRFFCSTQCPVLLCAVNR